ncbi:TIGR03089 family protein [Acidothermaceae bacterium B102]|nr:TIGR03089 family protein [Acidothermaceae bacterium B102]
MTPAGLLTRSLARDGARPLVTFYDDATGERVELSVATYANWVAKTANLLQDGLSAEPGERVAVLLPTHWQTAVILSACWSAGLVVATGLEAIGPADIVFTAADTVEAARSSTHAREVVALSLLPFARPAPGLAAGVLDYALEVPTYGDRFAPYSPVLPSDPAFAVEGRTLSGGELVEAAAMAGLTLGARVLSTSDFTDLEAVVRGLLAPLSVDGSVVLCRNLDASLVERRSTAEKVTTTT